MLVLGAGREILSSTYRRHFFSRGGKSKRPRARAEKYDEDRGTWTHDGENENGDDESASFRYFVKYEETSMYSWPERDVPSFFRRCV